MQTRSPFPLYCLMLAVFFTLMPSLRAGESDNAAEWGRENIAAGKYSDALTQLEKSLSGAAEGSAERKQISLVMIEAQRILGKLADAKALCDGLLKAEPKDAALLSLKAELDMEMGNYAEARDAFDQIIAEHSDNERAWALRSIVMRALNDRAGLKLTNDHFYDLYQKKTEYFNSNDVKDPLELAYIGLGFEDENPKDAFETGYLTAEQLAEERRTNQPEIFLWSAKLAYKVYNFGFAEERFAKLLKMRPNLPDALAGEAAVALETKHDLATAEKLLNEAFSVNPNHVYSNLVMAKIDLEEDRLNDAKKHIETAVAVNPRNMDALAMQAFYYLTLMQQDKYAEIEKKALAVNAKCADFYCDIGELCEDKLRFDSAPPWYQKALDIDPDYWRGYYGLGMNLSRQGADKCEKGKELLLKAFKKNRFNPWALNMIKALDRIIGDKEQNVAPLYFESKTKHFTLRFFGKEAGVVKPYLEEWAEAAYERQTKLFGYEPEGPLSIELCYSMQDQAARTVGLPNLGALGVCFGKLCTVVSPREGGGRSTETFNWRKVLEHEFGHVMALQLSKFRVPRWYTEAFSTYLEDDTRLESDSMMINYIARDKLRTIDKMHEYFRENMLMAYVHGRYVVEYIAKTYGFDAHVRAMKMFAEGKKLDEVLPAVTGKTLDELSKGQLEFTKKFFEHVRLRPNYDPALLVQLEFAAKPDDAPAQAIADLAIAMIATRKLERAEQLSKRALEKDPKCVDAINVLGLLAYDKKDFEGAKQLYKQSTQINPDRSFLAWQRLGVIYKKEAHTTLAIEAFEAARKSYPRYIGPDNPHYELAELYQDTEPPQLDKALGIWRDAITVNTQDPEACFKGLELAVKMKDQKAIVEFANAHLEIDPYKLEVHKILAKTYEELKDWPHVEREYTVATFLNDKDVESWTGLARAQRAQGKKSEALKTVKQALDIDGTVDDLKKMRDDLQDADK
jgi:tetratricopeptide (TPR) repeat protein